MEFIFGLVLGCIGIWLVTQSKVREIKEKLKAGFIREKSELKEQLECARLEVKSLERDLQNARASLDTAHQEIKAELSKRASAEAQLLELDNLKQYINEKDDRIFSLLNENSDLTSKLSEYRTALESEQKSSEEKAAQLEKDRESLSLMFESLSAKALSQNNKSFLQLAESALGQFQERAKGDLKSREQAVFEVVRPLKDNLESYKASLEKYELHLQQVEKDRISAYTSLAEQLKSVASTQASLQSETVNLVQALRAPKVRGRWGEIQLKRVVEIAGMLEHCDFVTQESVPTESGYLRPDMLVKLPNKRNIIVDSKVPLKAYLEAIEAPNEVDRISRLKSHARQVRRHISQLSEKSYWSQFELSPEFVVLFLPGEIFFSAALEQDPTLIEVGAQHKVILATPTTLIALLKAIAYGWSQEQVAENAKQIRDEGKDLYERIHTFAGHMEKLRKNLDSSVKSFNKAVGSLESRVLVSAQRLSEFGLGDEEVNEIDSIDSSPRFLEKLIPEGDSE